VLNIFL